MPKIEAPQFISPDLKPYVSRKAPLVHTAPPKFLSDEEIEVIFQQQLQGAGLKV